MNSIYRLVGALPLAIAAFATHAADPAPNGITLPEGYKDWRLISVSQRTDNNTIRAILGNDVAIKAARDGNTNPWPNGAVLAKLVWKNAKNDKWESAIEPGAFVHAEFMLKDSAKHAATGGWGYARWLGADQKPYGKDASFAQECVGCHTPVKDRDWVYTHPIKLP